MTSPPFRSWLAPLVLAIATAAAYANSLSAAFHWDDRWSILHNPTIRSLRPSLQLLVPPVESNMPGRPLVNYTLALNYAAGGLDVWGYHFANLLIHVAAGLLLYALVRRTLERRTGAAHDGLAFTIALLWLLHPLQTQAVTYVIQRAETLMSLFLLATLYCSARAFAAPRPGAWHAAAVLSCALGMVTKEVMVVAPLLVLLYDRIFHFGSLREALSRRKGLHAGLAATWLVTAFCVILAAETQAGTAGFDHTRISPARYLLTQAGVIAHYLRLAFWPHPLVFDYGWPIARGVTDVLPWGAITPLLALASLWACRAAPSFGFLGCAFFLVLGPTSSVMPIIFPAVEHRMYLPLACVIAATVFALHAASGRAVARGTWTAARARAVGVLAVALAATALGTLTHLRNRDYRTEVSLWGDTVAKRPGHAYARHLFALALAEEGRHEEAEREFRESLRLDPHDLRALHHHALHLAGIGRVSEAIDEHRRALALKPDLARARHHLGAALLADGRPAEAIPEFEAALRAYPRWEQAWCLLGVARLRLGDAATARAALERALEAAPGYALAHFEFGRALLAGGDAGEAGRRFAEAERLRPGAAEGVPASEWAARIAMDPAWVERLERGLGLDATGS